MEFYENVEEIKISNSEEKFLDLFYKASSIEKSNGQK